VAKAVEDAETPARDLAALTRPKSAHTVTTAAKDGDRLDLMIAMRDRVAKAVEDAETPARDLAALTRRLLEIAKEIDVLQAAAKKAEEDRQHASDERFDASAV